MMMKEKVMMLNFRLTLTRTSKKRRIVQLVQGLPGNRVIGLAFTMIGLFVSPSELARLGQVA